VDPFYRTRYGPCVDFDFVTYGNNNTNMSLGVTRLTKVRKPEIPGFHLMLQQLQRQFIADHLHVYLDAAEKYSVYFDSYTSKVEEVIAHYADPHEKRKLRIFAYFELIADGRLGLDNDTWLKVSKRGVAFCEWMLKLRENAKPGKLPRLVISLGTPASLAGFIPMELLKQAQSGCPIYYRGGVIYFCKSPKREALRRYFRELYALPWRYMFVYFSDDSVLGYWCDGVPHYHNLDISDCDASHTSATFDALVQSTPGFLHPDVEVLVDQCRAPLRVRSTYVGSGPRKVFLARPRQVKSYSGSTITTAINGVGNTSIGLAIGDLDEIRPELITHAAQQAGYVVTGAEPIRFEQLQFLKHSPVLVDGQYEPLLNVGVLLRLLGSVKMDLPGKGKLEQRGREFTYSLVNSAYPRARFTLVDRLRAGHETSVRPEIQSAVDELLRYRVEPSEDERIITFPDDEIAKRYDIPLNCFLAMSHNLGSCGFGEHYRDDATNTILKADYEMEIGAHNQNPWMGDTFEPRKS